MRNVMFTTFTVLLLTGTFSLFAQNPIEIGVKGGLSIPNLTSGSTTNPIASGYTSRVGADFAIHAEFYLSKHFSIEPQLEYSSQGGKRNGNQAFVSPGTTQILYADYKNAAKINYLMLPVLAKYRVSLSGKWGFYVAAGPFVDMVVSAKDVTSGSSLVYADAGHTVPVVTDPQSFDNTQDIKDDLHKTNWGFSGHVGFSYKVSKKSSVFVEGGGNYGFVKIQKSSTNGRNNTGAGVVVLGYAYRIRG